MVNQDFSKGADSWGECFMNDYDTLYSLSSIEQFLF